MEWIKRFIFFHEKHHPIELGEKEINKFLFFRKNIQMLQENGIGNMSFLQPNDLKIIIPARNEGIIYMKQLSKNL